MDVMQFHWIDGSNPGIAQFNRQMKILLSNIGVTRKKEVIFYDKIPANQQLGEYGYCSIFHTLKLQCLMGV